MQANVMLRIKCKRNVTYGVEVTLAILPHLHVQVPFQSNVVVLLLKIQTTFAGKWVKHSHSTS